MELLNNIPTLSGFKSQLIKSGYAATIKQVSDKVNKSSLDATTRILLAHEPLYIYLLHKAIITEGITDVQGIYNRVITHSEELRKELYTNIIDLTIAKNNKNKPDSQQRKELVERLMKLNPPLEKSEKYILDELSTIRKEGGLPGLINEYLKKFPETYFNLKKRTSVQKAMVSRLLDAGFEVDPHVSNPVSYYNDILFYAYSYAIKTIGEADDPVKNIFSANGHHTWDFAVDYFEGVEEQGVERENIMASGALYYIYVLGDLMGLYRITDAIILAWSHGRLDIPQGAAATRLYRYYRLRDNRSTTEERAMFYRQVLNLGEARVLDKMAVNADFSRMWDNLMTTVVEYIQKYETKEDNVNNISKLSVYQAIKDIQYNLSVSCSGMVKAIIPEMYAHLQSCIEILKEQAVVDQLGYGFQKSMWKVIERVSQSEFNELPNVSALRTLAVEGNKIFRFIADFDAGTVMEEDYLLFIRSCEAYIIAQSQLEGTPLTANADKEALIADTKEDDWDF